MRFKPLAAVAALALVSASTVAAAKPAAPAASASTVQRAGADAADANELRGTTVWLVGLVLVALAIWGIIELPKDDNNAPTSP